MAERDSRLTLLRELSRSGIATVWEAYDPTLDRKVLLKAINPQYARESDLRVRFEREARAIARLSHPNVVQIYDLRTSADDLSIVLEFIEGATLGKLLKDQGSLPCEVAVTIAGEILAGLEHAHAASIIHRDLKPDNVLVSVKGEVKITDFGLATLRDQPTVTQEGMVIGTPSYMAPEQAEGGEISAATDVFALGLILFEMLTGQRVHEGSTIPETVQNVLRYQPPHFETFRDVIPPALETVLRRMLERSPARRFASAAEARQALLQSQPEGFLPRTLVADFLSEGAVHRPTARAAARTRKWAHPLRAASIAILAVIGAVLVYYFSMVSHAPLVTSPPLVLLPADSTARIPEPVPTPPDSSIPDSVRGGEPPQQPHKPPEVIHTSDSDRVAIDSIMPESIAEPGFINLTCRPWASVYLRDSLVGTTPLSGPLKLPPGLHNLVLLNPEIGLPISRAVTVASGRTTELRINLYDFVARIRIASVKPWADVYVNGKLELRTPSSKMIFRPLGTYIITLKNPDFPNYQETLVFREADPVHEIRVDLAQRQATP